MSFTMPRGSRNAAPGRGPHPFLARGAGLVPVAVLAWTYLATFARAARLPNDFAEAHWLLDYRFGPMKRGLIGSLVSLVVEPFGWPITPALIAALSITLAVVAALVWLGIIQRMRSLHDGNTGLLALGLVFASSPLVIMNAHLIGYLDAILHVATAAAIAAVLRGKLIAAATVCAVAVLVHESFLLVGLPLVLLAAVMTGRQADEWRACPRRVLWLAGPPLALFAGLLVLQAATTDPLVLRAQLEAHLQSAGFVDTQSRTVAEWHTTGFGEFLHVEHGFLAERLLNGTVSLALAPSLLAFLVVIGSLFRIAPASRDAALLLLAIGAPLALHAVAWDTVRISTYTIGSALMATWILAEVRPVRPPSRAALLVAMAAFIGNGYVRVPLMDGEALRRFSPVVMLPALLLLVLATWRAGRPADGRGAAPGR